MMENPIVYPSTTTRFSLPFLFAGQAQKEPFINHAFSLIDASLTGVVDDSLATPPSDAVEGACYRVLENGLDDWEGQDGKIAMYIGDTWEFIAPYEGMSVYDAKARISYHFASDWQAAVEPPVPAGGSVIDVEARSTLLLLTEALRTAGIFAKNR